jgi:glutaredoxin-related protein
MMMKVSLTAFVSLVPVFISTCGTTVFAFVPSHDGVMLPRTVAARSVQSLSNGKTNAWSFDSVVDAAETGLRIVQQSQQDGAGFKQIMANVLAGDVYDAPTVNREIDAAIASAPLVLFTWAVSPSCKQAIRALDLMQAQYKIVRLDDPWEKGHAVRAELGKRQNGKCSVPAIYVNGEYIGGYDSGIGADRPGLVDLAFSGILPERLRQAGALSRDVPTATTMTTPNVPEMTILE